VDDGNIELTVVSVEGRRVVLRVVHGGRISSNKGMNLPGIDVSAPSLTEKDRADVAFGIEQDLDYFALSFVRRGSDITALRQLLPPGILIVAKVEKDSALLHMDEVVRAADAVMVARGDLGVELPYEAVPMAQKRLIAACNRLARPVITATQMLESMITKARPTRAEASDVANAVLDGTDALMLSAETAVGQFPTHAVRAMRRISIEVESHHRTPVREVVPSEGPASTEEVIAAATETATRLLEAPVICVFTKSGASARIVAAFIAVWGEVMPAPRRSGPKHCRRGRAGCSHGGQKEPGGAAEGQGPCPGAGRRRWRHVSWGVVREIGVAWLTTLPAAAILAVLSLPLWLHLVGG
jgi:pyruvate kinase